MSINYVNLDLNKLGLDKKEVFSKNRPFPHIVLDGLFSKKLLKKIILEMPNPRDKTSKKYSGKYGNKKIQTIGERNLQTNTLQFFHYLNSEPFLNFLETISGIKNLLPDPSLTGGGFHQILKGGYLKIHADFIKHNKYNFYRRLNLLIYLNENWNQEWGGNLELWDHKMEKATQSIIPNFNRMVLFNTTSNSYHGHPEPLKCPEDVSRKSIAIYYYTIEKPDKENLLNDGYHGTLYKERRGKDNFKNKFSFYNTIAKIIGDKSFFRITKKRTPYDNEVK